MSTIYFRDSENNMYLTRQMAVINSKHNSQIEFICGEYSFNGHQDVSYQEAEDYRVKEISDSYDYIQLFYSGGADSHSALKAFVRNGIPISEIILGRFSATKDFSGLQNEEVNITAVQFLNSISDYINKFKVKITFCDFGVDELRKAYSPDTFKSLHSSGIMCPTTYGTINFVWKNLREHKNMCQIVGWEKPSIQFKDNNFYTFMIDKVFAFLTTERDIFDIQENFYFGGDGFFTVNQFRRSTELVDNQDKTQFSIFNSANSKFINRVNKKLRNANECVLSNNNKVGKIKDGLHYPQRENLLYHHLKQIPSIWNDIIDYVGSDNPEDICYHCSFSNKKWSDVAPLVAKSQKIL